MAERPTLVPLSQEEQKLVSEVLAKNHHQVIIRIKQSLSGAETSSDGKGSVPHNLTSALIMV